MTTPNASTRDNAKDTELSDDCIEIDTDDTQDSICLMRGARKQQGGHLQSAEQTVKKGISRPS